ncbi:V-type ATP synthase subunit A [Halothermothrix orenii]|uniref:V-type ATP synthase alpha chain n=1 Tax=Halothermothrix orenii (strain H 168 / OCM 544 / DSM 9562) TaxID=373903 RepID=VATA_HALOH|nr:V-type ATP synthase subunit A [Halothermothrix orenii]B8CZG8.1 RecName: Full=V-type ATP synthase alpha chain; AltName: Full=V-ATPase subunit A [Halothermothrix orenii H 168]ACL70687.1 V-type ATP synthase subunit A [Halothermothrix orenii H 168]
MDKKGEIVFVNGPVVKADKMNGFIMNELVYVGKERLIGEIIELEGDLATIQVYEETTEMQPGEPVFSTGSPLSVELGPGIIGNIFDGIQRPLPVIAEKTGSFIKRGIEVNPLDRDREWTVSVKVKLGDRVKPGQVVAEVPETSIVTHRVMVPPHLSGEVVEVVPNGKYTVDQEIVTVKDDKGNNHQIRLHQKWPVRRPRPCGERLPIKKPLLTGQRVFDTFFPLGMGGTAAIPGGFGAGKTMTQHQLAKWSSADIIVYVGCGERGNEMTDVLEEFPKLEDPSTGKSMMERTVLIANTSNMPVAAREASIYTGITIAEFYRDMGYNVALMADSTSRWAEALREISGRLEEMPAEEGFPAYLPSRLAEFYERAGYVKTLGQDREGSISLIGAVSPPGGDFSEPVTQNTKRYVRCFWALDKSLASARHFPAVNWLESYSEYLEDLSGWLKENINEDWIKLRNMAMELLKEEDRLQEIVKLVGEDVLPDNQRLILEVARLIKIGFLQQNAFSKVDRFATPEKQYWMLKIIMFLYEKARPLIKNNIPISRVKNNELFSEVIKMKENIPNGDLDKFKDLMARIEEYYNRLWENYQE